MHIHAGKCAASSQRLSTPPQSWLLQLFPIRRGCGETRAL